jgi:hypothetical protein
MEKLHYRECETGRRFIIKLEHGAKLPQILVDFAQAQNLNFASLVSAVGSVCSVEISGIQAGAHLPMTEARFKTSHLEGPLELLSLEGNIAVGADKQLGGQFWVLASKSNGEVAGGRLVGAEVFTTCEIVLAEYRVEGVERHHSTSTGVDTIYIEEW